MSEQFTYDQVKQHNTKSDLYVVINDKVYAASKFIDEHPGGEEVMIDVAGQDATEAFEDVGHSDEAREILDGLKVGDLKRQPGDPQPKVQQQASKPTSGATDGSMGTGLYAIILLGAILAYATYYIMNQ